MVIVDLHCGNGFWAGHGTLLLVSDVPPSLARNNIAGVTTLGTQGLNRLTMRNAEGIRGMSWLLVVIAGALEMVWSYSAKQSDGFHKLGWAALTIGAIGSFLVGIALLGESADPWRIASAGLIVAGVIGLRLTSSQ
jgi:quaternary ammonium compound-resistance protein SugE